MTSNSKLPPIYSYVSTVGLVALGQLDTLAKNFKARNINLTLKVPSYDPYAGGKCISHSIPELLEQLDYDVHHYADIGLLDTLEDLDCIAQSYGATSWKDLVDKLNDNIAAIEFRDGYEWIWITLET